MSPGTYRPDDIQQVVNERLVDDEDYSRATCDQCGISTRARFVIALPSGGVVCYCGSHTKQHWAALTELGALIVELSTP